MPELPGNSPATVSIIMPVYNGEKYIRSAIQSVVGQTFQDWELCIINDGSTDRTGDVIRAIQDPRIIYFTQTNAGRSTARNVGLAKTHGTFVMFLDADDVLLQNCLEAHLGFLDSHPHCDASVSDCELVDETGKVIVQQSALRQHFVPSIGTLDRNGSSILERLVVSSVIIGAPHTVMIRRNLIDKTKARFDPLMFFGEDGDFWLQVAEQGIFGFFDEVVCRYLWHRQNTLHSHDKASRDASLLRGCGRVMKAVWFTELSLPTRIQFFNNLLIGLLSGQPDQQDAIMTAPPFLALPTGAQANLQRLVASSHLGKRQNTEFALNCLRRSLDLQPDSPKGRVLLQLGSRSPALAADVLSVWQHAHRILANARSFGRARPKPLPAALVPKTK